ncbi:MAG: FAD-dependent monooxygenase [Thermoleophilia bacterium]|nr:FAD-dependent monooxygenase [Thermoleophilia bacterium]
MRVVIAGGGLVGLSLAGLLRRRGAEPVVLERMEPGEYVRRGFMLGHHSYEALEELGVLAGIRARGRAIAPTPDGSSAAVAVEVGRLLHRLAEGIPVRYRHTVTGLLRDPSGRVTGVIAEGPDGTEELHADLVVACDGMRSRVRGMAGLAAEFMPLAEAKIEWMSPVPTEEVFSMKYLSDGGHIGFFSWPEGSFGWRSMDRCGREAAVAPGIAAFAEAFAALLPESADGVRGLVSTDELHYGEQDLLTCPEWWTPGVALIGDAAHFLGPETGASAGIGIADAHALAQALAMFPADADAACAAYTAWRAPAVRPLEAMDPSRSRLLGAPIPEARPEERWPPPAAGA